MESNGSCNVAVIRGVCTSPADVRVLPSDEVVAQLQVTTHVDGRALSVPVSVERPAAWVEQIEAGTEVIVIGPVRRRYFKAGAATASRVEIEASMITRPRDRRRLESARRRIDELLAAFDT